MKTENLIEKTGGIQLDNLLVPSSFNHIVTDTRFLEKGDIFVALKGQKQDGHDYIDEAIKKGASIIFVEEDIKNKQVPIIKVTDTYQCLFDLASCYLEQYPVFTVAITGSVGKTTTKELIASILSKKYQVLKSKGNKNNRIGLPETIFELNPKIECLVVELGMNHRHEIEKLSDLVKPNIAVITNIGSAHIGNLGSKKNILKAKMEIIHGMTGGVLFVNGHDILLNKQRKIPCGKIKTVYKDKGKIQIELLEQSIFGSKILITDGIEHATVFFEVPGEAIIDDIALAFSVGDYLDVPFDKMIEVLEEYRPLKQRMLVEQLPSGNILINDCYNSSYESLKMDLDLLKKSKEHKILILGDILELGSSSKRIHQKIGKEVGKIKNVEIHFIGREMKYAYKKCKKGKYFKNNSEWSLYWGLKENIEQHSIILLKGSRRMKLEELIPYIIGE